MLSCARTPSARMLLNGRRASWRSSAQLSLASPASARAWVTHCASRCYPRGWSPRGNKANRRCSGRRQQRHVRSVLGLRRVSDAGAPRAAAWRKSWPRWREASAQTQRERSGCPAQCPPQPCRCRNSPVAHSAAWRRRPNRHAPAAAWCCSCAVLARRALALARRALALVTRAQRAVARRRRHLRCRTRAYLRSEPPCAGARRSYDLRATPSTQRKQLWRCRAESGGLCAHAAQGRRCSAARSALPSPGAAALSAGPARRAAPPAPCRQRARAQRTHPRRFELHSGCHSLDPSLSHSPALPLGRLASGHILAQLRQIGVTSLLFNLRSGQVRERAALASTAGPALGKSVTVANIRTPLSWRLSAITSRRRLGERRRRAPGKQPLLPSSAARQHAGLSDGRMCERDLLHARLRSLRMAPRGVRNTESHAKQRLAKRACQRIGTKSRFSASVAPALRRFAVASWMFSMSAAWACESGSARRHCTTELPAVRRSR